MCFAPVTRGQAAHLTEDGHASRRDPCNALALHFNSLNPRSTQMDFAGFQVTVRESEWREMDESKEM